jgi:hypothetical protein
VRFIIATARTADRIGNLFGVATLCEGDVTIRYVRTKGPSRKR